MAHGKFVNSEQDILFKVIETANSGVELEERGRGEQERQAEVAAMAVIGDFGRVMCGFVRG